MEKVCVVIPIHSSNPSKYELISFKQCFSVLNKRPIKIIAPKGLVLDKYREVVPDFDTIFIDPSWQSTLLSYNELKLSLFFYNLFQDYKFLLTYELDAFVFNDDLDYWCKQDYDYIGAPWFEGYSEAQHHSKIIGVGNSGFSLRKVKSLKKIIRLLYYKNPEEFRYGRKNVLNAYFKLPIRWLRTYLSDNYKIRFNGIVHEDIIIKLIGDNFSSYFNIAPVSEAIKFSFEVNPKQLFKINDNRLPTGCHAWWKYDFCFWKPYIEYFGYVL